MKKLLNFEVIGETDTKRIILIAHGLFGSHKNWRSIAKCLAELDYKVIIVDMRNHGSSFWAESHSYEDLAGDLSRVIAQFGVAADVIGHSMGGKAAMTLALLYSDFVEKLIVVDIAPVQYHHSQVDHINALESIDLNLINTRKEMIELLSSTIENPDLRAFFSQSVDFSNIRQKKWLLNLSALKHNLPNIMDFPQLHRKNALPTLVIRGSLSDYILDKYLPSFNYFFPNYELSTIEGGGHWLHTEKRHEFLTLVAPFLMD